MQANVNLSWSATVITVMLFTDKKRRCSAVSLAAMCLKTKELMVENSGLRRCLNDIHVELLDKPSSDEGSPATSQVCMQ